MEHDLKDIGVLEKSKALSGRQIGFGVCGGIGAVETVKLIRELRRHGAEVTAFLTPEVSRFITPLSISWACAKPAITEPGYEVDHLESLDLVLVAPATLNTIAKAAHGMADNPVTLAIAGQIGRKAPVLFVPAMNLQLKSHPAYETHKQTLVGWGSKFLETPFEEGRLKMPDPETLSRAVIELVGK